MISSSVAILTAFFSGCALLDDELWSNSMASVSLSLMLVGMAGVCWCNEISRYMRGAEARSPLLQDFRLEASWRKAPPAAKGAGLLLTAVGGLAAGVSLVPWR